MTYILIAIVVLIAFLLNVTFDKAGSSKVSGILATAIKSTISSILLLLLIWMQGDIGMLFHFSSLQEILYTLFFGFAQIMNWFFYFFAIKRSKIDAFTSFNELTFLLLANVWTLIFNFSGTVNSNLLSLSTYFLGLGAMVLGIVFVGANKSLSGENRTWEILDITACIFGTLLNVVYPLKVTTSSPAIMSFYTLIIVSFVSWICCFILKEFKNMKQIGKKTLLFLFLGSFTNVAALVLRFFCVQMPGANIAIINAIVSSYFVIITLIDSVFNKKKFPQVIWMAFFLMIVGMVLNSIAFLIK